MYIALSYYKLKNIHYGVGEVAVLFRLKLL